MSKKIAIVFPGIGYHVDKPLLYYSIRLARQYGYQIKCVDYGTLPSGIKGDSEKMKTAFYMAYKHVTEILSEVDFSSFTQILFISKSIGTAVAAAYELQNQLGASQIYYTPVEESFQAIGTTGIVFHGAADDWARTAVIQEECAKRNLPLFITEHANHSLETGDIMRDLDNLKNIMEKTEKYIKDILL